MRLSPDDFVGLIENYQKQLHGCSGQRGRHFYLNQCRLYPITAREAHSTDLLTDIRIPSFLVPCLLSVDCPLASPSHTASFSSLALTEDHHLVREQLPSLHSVNLWVSVGGTASNMHYDCYHGLLCVVHGSKHVTLRPPAHTRHLRPHPVHGKATNHSQLSVRPRARIQAAG